MQLDSSVDFSCSVPLAGCLAAASGEETDPHFSEKCLIQLSRPLKGQKGLPQVGVPLALLLIRPATDDYSKPRHK